MITKYGGWLLLVGLAACSSPPAGPKPSPPKLIEGMWSDPPETPEGMFCFFTCTQEGIDYLNALLDDPANDSRPYPDLLEQAKTHERETYFRPRLTAAALETYPLDPADDPGFLRCEPWGLARQMFAPHQIEIRRAGDDRVELRYGEWEARRTVFMDGRARPAGDPLHPLGYSVGRWEGETLIVETSGVTANITGWDFKHSDQFRTVERFTRSEDGETLTLTATVTDPWSLREAMVIKKVWTWAPQSQITPYENCEPATSFERGVSQP